MKCVASTDFPTPEGPATRMLSPSRMPPPIILSNSGTPMESRRRRIGFILFPANLCAAHHGAKRVHHHETRLGRRNLFDDFLEHRVQILIHQGLAQINKADSLA